MPNGWPEEVEASVIDNDLMISRASFEIDMSGIQRDVEELTEAIDEALTVYGEMLVEPDAIAGMGFYDTRNCERAISAAIRSADELRRKLNRDYKAPLDTAKARYDELMGPVIELHGAYKQRRVQLEDEEKNRKLQEIRSLYEDMASQIALPIEGQDEALVPFARIYEMFGAKWLNKSCTIGDVELQLVDIVRGISAGEQALNGAELAHEVEARAVYWQTLDVDRALERDRELCAAEARQAALEAERAELAQLKPAVEPAPTPAPVSEPAPTPEIAEPVVPPAAVTPSAPIGERTPRVMLIEGATDDECRQIGQFCKSLGISGVFKGERFYQAIKGLA